MQLQTVNRNIDVIRTYGNTKGGIRSTGEEFNHLATKSEVTFHEKILPPPSLRFLMKLSPPDDERHRVNTMTNAVVGEVWYPHFSVKLVQCPDISEVPDHGGKLGRRIVHNHLENAS